MIYKKLISISFLLALTACNEEEVDLHFADGDIPYEIVVQGGVCSVMGKQLVYISKPMSVNDTIAIPVSNATVEVSDGQNAYAYCETENAGEYASIDEFAGKVGKTYSIMIEYEGRKYFGSDNMVECDSIQVEYLPVSVTLYKDIIDHIEINQADHTFGYKSRNIWINGYIIDTVPSPSIIYSWDHTYTHSVTYPQGVFQTRDVTYGFGGRPDDYIRFVKMSVSDNYYKYLISKLNLTEWASGTFSTIPDNVYTNMSKGCTGYFFASDVKILTVQCKNLLVLQ